MANLYWESLTIENFRPIHGPGKLRAQFDVDLGPGLRIIGLRLFQKADGDRSVFFPAQKKLWDRETARFEWAPVVEILDPVLYHEFLQAVLRAIDKLRHGGSEKPP
jgi:hypothetical protein